MGRLCELHLVELGVLRPLMLGSNPIEAWIVVDVGQLFWMTHLWFSSLVWLPLLAVGWKEYEFFIYRI